MFLAIGHNFGVCTNSKVLELSSNALQNTQCEVVNVLNRFLLISFSGCIEGIILRKASESEIYSYYVILKAICVCNVDFRMLFSRRT